MTDLVAHLPGFAAAYAVLIVAASSPGPAVALLFGIGTAQGRRAALAAALGIATGSVVLNLGTLLGVGLILSQAAWAMHVIRSIGAAYLAWLAWTSLRKAAATDAAPRPAPTSPRPPGRLFLAGVTLQVTNPKAIVFWLAITAIGATAEGEPLTVATFVAGAFAISLLCHGAWAIVLSSALVRAAYARARRWIEGALGAFFAVAAVRMAMARG